MKNNNPQVEASHYKKNYDNLERWCSYWYQIEYVLRSGDKNILEVGVGNKTVSEYLRRMGFKVTTCDYAQDLEPDVVADVTNLPFKKNQFETVLCYEVLEHLPYESFLSALTNLYKVARTNVMLSIPQRSGEMFVHYRIPRFKERKVLWTKPHKPRPVFKFNGVHYWELESEGHSLERIQADIVKAGFTIRETNTYMENTYHRFFWLTK